ncbi:prolipoprotein diacylglyceryl transferase [Mycobacterium sp. Marseille-P9652]|uniref:prolipoprotein diacylglyceryl transferase n=1 Tax=Mycobacterium sp. Marseille-P9652 TaxID=2654950 RepID=UPI001E4D395D|nr:prolipoprotein diacylglyceryl transferase [Mycobacterium sp. Marseille-P9652]
MTRLLAYFPSPPQGVWHVGPLPIRAYALFIIAGIVAALVIGDRRWEARGGERGVIYDVALWAVPFGLVGGRLYHLATDWRTYWGPGGAGLGAALRVWDGGLGIWGAVALGAVGAWIACRRHGIPLPAFGDAIAPGIILAQAIGRLGNYFNQELYGRETKVPWGLEIFYRRDPSGYVDPHSLDGVSTGQVAMVVQPTFLYELIWNLIVFAALLYLDRRYTLGHGRLFALYVAGYCVGRFVVELLRDDTATHIAGIRINSFTSTFVFIGAVVYFMVAPKGREDPESLRGNAGVVEVEPGPAPTATDSEVTDAELTDAEPTDAEVADAVGPGATTEAAEPATVATAVAEPITDEPAAAEPEPETADEPEEPDKPEEPEEPDEPDGGAVADELPAAAETGSHEPEEAEHAEEGERSDQAEKSEEPEPPATADESEEAGEPAEADEPEKADQAEDAVPAAAPTADVQSTAVEYPSSDDEVPRRRWGLRRRNRG